MIVSRSQALLALRESSFSFPASAGASNAPYKQRLFLTLPALPPPAAGSGPSCPCAHRFPRGRGHGMRARMDAPSSGEAETPRRSCPRPVASEMLVAHPPGVACAGRRQHAKAATRPQARSGTTHRRCVAPEPAPRAALRTRAVQRLGRVCWGLRVRVRSPLFEHAPTVRSVNSCVPPDSEADTIGGERPYRGRLYTRRWPST